MSAPIQSQFRITPWPAEPLPLPPPEAMFGEVFVTAEDDEGWEVDGPQGRPFGETYLELYALDLDDLAAIKGFVQRWGPLGVRHPVWARDFDHGYMGFPRASCFHLVTEELAATSDPDPFVETENDFRLGAWCLADLTTAWRILSGDLGAAEATWLTPCWSNSTEPIDAPESWQQAATPEIVLSAGMSEALRPFAPTVNFSVEGHGVVDPRTYNRTMEERAPYFPDPSAPGAYGGELPLFSICCLELFNHIAEGASYRTCANETCDRFFVRQLGRAEHGQHRSIGVKYCSPECKQMQVQREYRRRKAKKDR